MKIVGKALYLLRRKTLGPSAPLDPGPSICCMRMSLFDALYDGASKVFIDGLAAMSHFNHLEFEWEAFRKCSYNAVWDW